MRLDSDLNLTGIGLFVFSDPGGAKAVLSAALQLKLSGNVVYVISDRKYEFYTDFELTVDEVPESIDKFLLEVHPNYIFTGTSYTSNIELRFLVEAKKKNIPTFSFIDHWTNFKSRFYLDSRYIYPDKILVIDEKALEIAIQEGIDKNCLVLYNNPYYQYLKSFKPKSNKLAFFSDCGITVGSQKIIVFAPDPLSNINGASVYGFDELDATTAIGAIMNDIKGDFLFFIKLHPNQKIEKIRKLIHPKMIILDSLVDNNTLIYYSDLVIGFFSNFLIEANVMNKKVIRFHLTDIINDPLKGKDIGVVVGINGLKSEIENISK